MKKPLLWASLSIILLAGLYFGLTRLDAKWSGVDETVVEKFARAAGREPQPPLIDIEHGDLPLFFFLMAGTIGGFVAGYNFHTLFPPKPQPSKPSATA